MNRPLVFYPLLLLLFFLGISASFGGWVLMANPEIFGATPELLDKSPVKRFSLFGFILFVFNGLFPLFAAIGLLLKPDWRWANALNIYRDRHWGWTYSLFSGIIIMVWIAVQITVVPNTWLQPAYLAVGLLILIFTLWPSMMRHYQFREK